MRTKRVGGNGGRGWRLLLPETSPEFCPGQSALGLKKLRQLLLPHLWLVWASGELLLNVIGFTKESFFTQPLTEVMYYKIRLQNFKYVKKNFVRYFRYILRSVCYMLSLGKKFSGRCCFIEELLFELYLDAAPDTVLCRQ